MSNPIVVLDCDDVLAIFRTVLALATEVVAKQPADWREWNEFSTFHEKYNISKDEVMQHLIDIDALAHLQPEQYASHITRLLHRAGYTIIVLTARGFYPHAKTVTEQWLNLCDIYYDEVIVVDHQVSKADVIATLGEVALYVDDNADHIQHSVLLPNIKHVVLKNMPWNASINYPNRIDCLSEVLDYLDI